MSKREALEAGILGHMMIDHTIIAHVQKRLTDDYQWCRQEYADLWFILTAIYEQGATVDAINVKTVLDAGPEYGMGFQAGIEHVARILDAAPNIEIEKMLDLLLENCAICGNLLTAEGKKMNMELCFECNAQERDVEK